VTVASSETQTTDNLTRSMLGNFLETDHWNYIERPDVKRLRGVGRRHN
jgi:hypothetical protein